MTNDGDRLTRLNRGLKVLAPMMGADGFRLDIGDASDQEVEVILTALHDACLDCLVPDETLKAILLSELKKHDTTVEVITLTKVGMDK